MIIELVKAIGFSYEDGLRDVIKEAVVVVREFDDSQEPGASVKFSHKVSFRKPNKDAFVSIENLTKENVISFITEDDVLMRELRKQLGLIKNKTKKITFDL